jgi:hypothetical protein
MGPMFGPDAIGGRSYVYRPQWEKDVDYSPDRNPSQSRNIIRSETGKDLLWVLEVRNDNGGMIGVLTFRAIGDPSGKLQFKGVATFSRDQIFYHQDDDVMVVRSE